MENDTNFILAYEQNPFIYDYIYTNGFFYKNNTFKRQYHFPQIDLTNNKLDIVDQNINSNSIIYFCMNEFESLIQILGKNLSKNYVLLADGGDGNLENLDLPSNILHVYCPNLPFYNKKYSPYPRGVLKSNYLKGHNNLDLKQIVKLDKIYVNFTVYSYSSFRQEDFNYWNNQSILNNYITIKHTNHNDNESYWKDLYVHKFNIISSPASTIDKNKNRDTYRLWETLVAKSFPIAKKSPMMEFFKNELNLPIILVDSWEEINLEKLNKIALSYLNKNFEATKEDFWIKKLRNHFIN